MTSTQRARLLKAATALLGAGVISVSLFIGQFDDKAQAPAPITVDGQTIHFTWTDENKDETLPIYTDQRDYQNGIAGTTVYAAVHNTMDVAQDIELLGFFVNDRRYIEEVYVLTEVEEEGDWSVTTVCQEDALLEGAATTSGEVTCNDIQTELQPNTVKPKWVPLSMKERTVYEISREDAWLAKGDAPRKTVDGYVAEEKTFGYRVPAGGVIYYKLELRYPANDTGNFFLQAVGSAGGYGHLDPWFDANWDYRAKIEVAAAKVGSSTAVTNFPVYFNLAHMPAGFWSNVQSDGDDIRVIESNETTETAFEVVSINTTSQTGELHFLADSLSTTSTTTFYVYYGNTGASGYADNATYGQYNVWSTYSAVWHMQEGSGSRLDSDADTNDLTAIATPATSTGKLGTAVDIEAGDLDGLSITDANQVGLDMTSNHTLSCWANPETTNHGGTAGLFVGKLGGGGQQSYLYRYNGDFIINLSANGTSNVGRQYTYSMTGGTWYDVDFVYRASAGAVDIYVDSVLRSTQTGFPTSIRNGTAVFYLGGTDNGQWDGFLDECRIANSSLSSSWIITEYNNQSSPQTFYYVGAQESNAPSPSNRRILRVN